MYRIFMAAAMAVVMAGGMGCGKAKQVATDKAVEAAVENAAKQEGKDLDLKVNSANGGFQMAQTSDGGKTTSSFGEGTKLPANFLKDIPLYDGVALVMAQATTEEGNNMISGTVEASLEKVVAFYKEKMAVPGQTETTLYKKDTRMLNVTLNVESGKVALVLAESKS